MIDVKRKYSSGTGGTGIQSATVNASGHLIITLTDSTAIDAGEVVGEQGIQGLQGVGVQSAAINGSNHLILTLTDSTTIDAGVLPTGGGSGDMTKAVYDTVGDGVAVNRARTADTTILKDNKQIVLVNAGNAAKARMRWDRDRTLESITVYPLTAPGASTALAFTNNGTLLTTINTSAATPTTWTTETSVNAGEYLDVDVTGTGISACTVLVELVVSNR